MIYFIQNTNTLAIKIGHSNDPIRRLAGLQTSNHDRLILLAMFVGGPEKERQLHERYKDQKLGGEWFDGSIMKSDYLAVFENPAARPKVPRRIIKIGRPAKIWWREKRGQWFATINGRQISLGPDREKAEQEFYLYRPELAPKQNLTVDDNSDIYMLRSV